MDNFELFLEQVKIYREIEKRRKNRLYALTFGVLSFILIVDCFFIFY